MLTRTVIISLCLLGGCNPKADIAAKGVGDDTTKTQRVDDGQAAQDGGQAASGGSGSTIVNVSVPEATAAGIGVLAILGLGYLARLRGRKANAAQGLFSMVARAIEDRRQGNQGVEGVVQYLKLAEKSLPPEKAKMLRTLVKEATR